MDKSLELLWPDEKEKIMNIIQSLSLEIRYAQFDIEECIMIFRHIHALYSHIEPRNFRTPSEVLQIKQKIEKESYQKYPEWHDKEKRKTIIKENEENVKKYQEKLSKKNPNDNYPLSHPDVKLYLGDKCSICRDTYVKQEKKWWEFW